MPTRDELHEELDGDLLRMQHSTNLVNVPTRVLADHRYNDNPIPLHISGVREMNKSLFEMLGDAESVDEAAGAFENYMHAMFGLEPELKDQRGGPRRYRSSYLRLLQGWGYDANSPEGAVVKGWAESRFGLLPTFHKEPITRIASQAWASYITEKMSARFHNNAIYVQLDMLYEFAQWQQARYGDGSERITLYRGVNDFAEHPVIEQIDKRNAVIALNSVLSFTDDRDVADCFGDSIITVEVPRSKILFFKALMRQNPLKGESEYLVIGGDYRVSISR